MRKSAFFDVIKFEHFSELSHNYFCDCYCLGSWWFRCKVVFRVIYACAGCYLYGSIVGGSCKFKEERGIAE